MTTISPDDWITFLLTDVVGSTRLWDHAPDVMNDALVQHDALMRDTVTNAGGRLIKSRGEGDSTFSVFDHPAGALRAAVDAQRALAAAPWPVTAPISVRMAVYSGDAVERDGDFYGTTVNRAARLRSIASGGEVLVGGAAASSLAGRLPVDVALVEIGLRTLRDLTRPEMVYAVEAEGVRAPSTDSAQQQDVPLPSAIARPAPGGLYGRDRELQLIREAFENTRASGDRHVVLIGGRPGMGKTRIASEAARAAYAAGAIVLHGRSAEGLSVPFQAIGEALGHLLRNIESDLVRDDETRAMFGVLVPDLDGRSGRPPRSDVSPMLDRYVLFSNVARALQTAAAGRPVVMVLDDIQWADAGTVEILRYLLAAELRRVLIVATYRDTDIAGTPIEAVLAGLWNEPGVCRIDLGGLETEAVVALAEAAAGHGLGETGRDLAERLLRDTDGSPFLVTELLRHLIETGTLHEDVEGRWTVQADLSEIGLPRSVHEVVRSRASRVGEGAVTVLGTAGVIGPEFDVDVLSAVLGQDEGSLLALLDRAEDAGLVHGTSVSTFRFDHAFIGRALAEPFTSPRRARIHARIAAALRATRPVEPAAVANHWLAAGSVGDAAQTFEWTRRAGDDALARLVPLDAVRWYSAALDQCERAGVAQRDRLAIRIARGDAQRQAGDPAHREALLEAAREAEQLGDIDLLVAAALANNRGYESVSGGVDMERVEILRGALRSIGEGRDAERARLLATLAAELTFHKDRDETLAIADDALAIARRLGDTRIMVHVLGMRFLTILAPDRLDECLSNSEEYLSLAQRLGDPVAEVFAGVYRANACLGVGDIAGVDAAIGVACDACGRVKQPLLEHLVGTTRAWRVLLAGDISEADRLATEAFTIGAGAGIPEALGAYAAQLVRVREAQGRLEELLPTIEEVALRPGAVPAYRVVLCMVYGRLGRDEDARKYFDAEAACEFATLPWDRFRLIGMCGLAEVCAHLRAERPAALLYERLRPFADQVSFSLTTTLGSVAYHCAILATVLGRYEDADTLFRLAEARNLEIGAPLWVAQTRCEWTAMLLERDEQNDRDRAKALIDAAYSDAQRLGWRTIVSKCERLISASQ
jgi:class 3 adenylate cyclase/tetratricopeptide (TPR) repeat protein